MNHKVAR